MSDNSMTKVPAALLVAGGVCMVAVGFIGLGLLVAAVGACWLWEDSDG